MNRDGTGWIPLKTLCNWYINFRTHQWPEAQELRGVKPLKALAGAGTSGAAVAIGVQKTKEATKEAAKTMAKAAIVVKGVSKAATSAVTGGLTRLGIRAGLTP